jgi:hypothetical protein
MKFVILSLIIIVSCILLLIFFPNTPKNEEYQDPTTSPPSPSPSKEKEQISKQELREQVGILFKKIDDEQKRHEKELLKIYDGLKTALSLSLAPNKTLPEKPQRKISELCKFALKGPQFKKAQELYNKNKTNPNFELVQLYQTPIGQQSKDFKNKVKTYGYIYLDNTPRPDEPIYKQQTKKEYYGNISFKFDDKCNVIEFVSIDENIYIKNSPKI